MALLATAGLGGICLLVVALMFSTHSTNADTGKLIYEPLTFAAFNVQNLGPTKFRKADVMDVVRKIILRYDCICLQEVVTQDQSLLEELLNKVNEESDNPYLMTASERLGRDTTAKEQYVYLYREDRLRLINSEVYPDANAKFIRPPYIVHMESTTKDARLFVAFCVHTKPDSAAQEISALAEVFDYTKSTFRTEDTIIMGDFNAACGSVRVTDWPNIDLFTRPEFLWLVNDSIDTSSYTSGCANDRIVIAGTNMKSDYITNSARAFNFEGAYSLTTQEAHAVSDHYPVEMAMKGKVSRDITEKVKADICVIVNDIRNSDPQVLIDRRNDLEEFDVVLYKDENGNNIRVDATAGRTDINEILSLVDQTSEGSLGVISQEAAETLKYKAKFGSLTDSGAHTDPAEITYSLTVDCFVSTSQCFLQICKSTYYN